jgi:hypothetical protein
MVGNRKRCNKNFNTVCIDLKLRQKREWKLNTAIRANKPNPRTIYRTILKIFVMSNYFYIPLGPSFRGRYEPRDQIVQISVNNLSGHSKIPRGLLNLIADKEVPYCRNIQTGLADRIG